METKNSIVKQEQPGKEPEKQEASVRQMQAMRLNRYVKNVNGLLKEKKQNAPE